MYISKQPQSETDKTPVSGSQSGSAADEPTHVSDGRPVGAASFDDGRPTIDGFELHEELHRGGQGIVYRATQLGTRRLVAIKVLLDGAFASEIARRRFEREVELAASLRHPNIVTVLNSGVAQGRFYFAMEFIDGWRLDHYLRNEKPELRTTLALFQRICDAVNFAHQRGVIHRDLKPSNMLVDREGQPHLLDFGLAKTDRPSDPRETTVAVVSTTGQVLGTLAYMSPEQAAGSLDVDVRSDVYSLGVNFYEGLLEQSPYPVDGSLGEILNRIAHDEPMPPRIAQSKSRFKGQIDDELETILLKALEKEPNRRYQTAGDLGRDIERYLTGEPIEAKRASGLYMLKKTLKRYRIQATAAGLLLAMLIVFLAIFAVLYRKESAARNTAEQQRARADEAAEEAANAALKAALAEKRESDERAKAEREAARAVRSAEELRAALVAQKLQRGDLATLRGDLAEARDSFWEAHRLAPENPAALWELREYYMSSGDAGATQLYLRSYGPVAFSASGALSATCEAPHSITVRGVEGGKSVTWLATPGEVLALDVEDDGAIAAAGVGWSAMWPAGQSRASDVARWPGEARPMSVHVLSEREWAVVMPGMVRRFAADGGQPADMPLRARAAAEAAYSAALGLLAIPTETGVELVRAVGGPLKVEKSWRSDGTKPPRVVRFVDDELLGVLSDSLDVVFASGAQQGNSVRVLSDIGEWSMFDLRRGIGVVALAASDGRVATYRSGTREDAWQLTREKLLALRLTPDGDTLLTLDERGSLTRWDRTARGSQQRRLLEMSATHWSISDDGATIVFADPAGRVFNWSPVRSDAPVQIPLPSLMNMLVNGRPSDLSLSLSRDGREAVIQSDDRIWFKTLARPRAQSFRWQDAETPRLREVQLSGDGKLLALLAETETGDRQIVSFHRPARVRAQAGAAITRATLLNVGTVTDFVGSTVRAMQFVPGSEDLFVARSNGALLLIQANASGGASDGPTTRELARNVEDAWAALDSAAYRLAVDRAGRQLAAACDDGTVRVLNVLDTSERTQIAIGGKIGSMSFSPDGAVLMVRTDDGQISLHDLATGDQLAQWKLRAGDAAPLATWIGGDVVIATGSDGIYEIQHRNADGVIARSRVYAAEREIARQLGGGDGESAWAECEALAAVSADAAREMRLSLLDVLLRRARGSVPDAWLVKATESASPTAIVRLAHAAYEGAKIELAHKLFARAADAANFKPDDRTLWRAAECEYLLGDAARAAEAFARLRTSDALSNIEQTRAGVEYVAALVRCGRLAEADAETRASASKARRVSEADLLAVTASSAILSMLTKPDSDPQQSASLRLLVSLFPKQWVEYRDDIEFFAGELELARGRQAAAKTRFQRCIDTARDQWPVEWARLRLKQLAAKGGK